MSRFRNAVRSLTSGYAAVGFNVLYTLACVPLALHYLSKKEYGLWTLVVQVATYLLLLDAGITASFGRILMDHKDEKGGGQYGTVMKTGGMVLLTQGGGIMIGGLVLSIFISGLLRVPAQYAHIFQLLFASQCALVGLFFPGRVFMGVLQAHQRFDVLGYTQMLQLSVSFAVQWLTFHWGWGLYSLLAASGAAMACGLGNNLGWVIGLRLLPPTGAWGSANWKVFKEIFAFSNDLFLIMLGLQLLNYSQGVIIARTLGGFEVVTTWSVASKTFLLAFQLVQRFFDYFAVAFGEMIVRAEFNTLRRRYRDVLGLTSSLAVFVVISVAVCNGAFLRLWTKGEVSWPWWDDALMGLLLLMNSITRCQIGLSISAKETRGMRWIYFLEGACFCVMAYIASKYMGLPGIILSGVVSNVLWSGSYGIRWAAKYLGTTSRDFVSWLAPAGKFLLFMVVIAAVAAVCTHPLPPIPHFLVEAALVGILGAFLFWKNGVTAPLRKEIVQRLKPNT